MSVSPSPSQQYPNPTTPAFADDVDWFMAYLKIHALSQPSMRYAYAFWLAIGLVTLTITVLHSFDLRSGTFGAHWSKWSLRRRTWRKKHSLDRARKAGQPHKQPVPLPSNAQLLCFFSLATACLAATFVGPDYIAPANRFWVFRRSAAPDVTAYKPQYTIQKAWWSSGGRAGLMSFALFPLCLLFALKRPPFAIFAISFLTNIHFDKLIWLHRWTGRLIWAMAALHVALWSVQLANDTRNGTGKVAYVYAWQYPRFIYAWTAFGLLTLLTLLSLGPIRHKHYEIFYALHVILVPATIVMSALHYPPLWWWCWLSLLLWGGERTWRATNWIYINGFLSSSVYAPQIASVNQLATRTQGWEMYSISPGIEPDTNPDHGRYAQVLPQPSFHSDSGSQKPPPYHSVHFASSTHSLLPPVPSTFSIPVGYAHAEVLAGRTVRLRLIPPGQVTWAPGQHFLLCIPSVSKFVSHPFTCASVCDEQKPGDDGRAIMFLIRAKNGWTKDLWTTIVGLVADGRRHPAQEAPVGTTLTLPTTGVLLRAWIDGPFGSPTRTNWGLYSTAVIISGGSGVSFGVSILEYLCLCMTGRDGHYLGGNVKRNQVSAVRRIRFIWILRDFAHMQWCASILQRCKSLGPPESLQLDLFVTNFNPSLSHTLGPGDVGSMVTPTVPNTSSFVASSPRYEDTGVYLDQDDFIEAENPDGDYVDLSYYTGEYNESGELGHEEHQLDLTNFDGDNDDQMPGETTLNRALKKEGTIRRALTRKVKGSHIIKRSLQEGHVFGSTKPLNSPAPLGETSHVLPSSFRYLDDAASLSYDNFVRPQLSPRSSRVSILSDAPPTPQAPSPIKIWDTSGYGDRSKEGLQDWKRRSTSSAISQASSMQALIREVSGELKLELGDKEMRDISIMAEFARPGRPKLDLILQDEVGRAGGRIVVACCGPTTLNAVVRKVVAAQIDPSRIKRGDKSGSIELVAEDFAY
ncbi:hypothetical protein B0F90DRAFT_1808149 [Multifurca ochricompacta]|uniref:ferric-chelate reductase (NADPH) n=1 Tax=Multifurca ochricompacta TaxID=376703 RepID=A0AAD4QS04_9AGAM|nr:hypothetical protein B0F90DRAFT_1808149 [Multifurca ochricompacta]